MEQTVKSTRRPAAKTQAGKARPKQSEPDGLADHQRNPLAPPINITSNG